MDRRKLHATADAADGNYWEWLRGKSNLGREETVRRFGVKEAADRNVDTACRALLLAMDQYRDERTLANYEQLLDVAVRYRREDEEAGGDGA